MPPTIPKVARCCSRPACASDFNPSAIMEPWRSKPLQPRTREQASFFRCRGRALRMRTFWWRRSRSVFRRFLAGRIRGQFSGAAQRPRLLIFTGVRRHKSRPNLALRLAHNSTVTNAVRRGRIEGGAVSNRPKPDRRSNFGGWKTAAPAGRQADLLKQNCGPSADRYAFFTLGLAFATVRRSTRWCFSGCLECMRAETKPPGGFDISLEIPAALDSMAIFRTLCGFPSEKSVLIFTG